MPSAALQCDFASEELCDLVEQLLNEEGILTVRSGKELVVCGERAIIEPYLRTFIRPLVIGITWGRLAGAEA